MNMEFVHSLKDLPSIGQGSSMREVDDRNTIARSLFHPGASTKSMSHLEAQ